MRRQFILLVPLLLFWSGLIAQSKAEKYFLQGRSKYDRGEYKATIKWLDKSIALDSTITNAYTYRGAAELELLQLDRAKIDLDRALFRDSSSHFALYSRGRLNSLLFEHANAINDLNKAIYLKPKNAKYVYARAMALRAADEQNEAILALSDVIEMDSLFYRAFRERGTVYAQIGDTAKARIDLDSAIALAPKDPVSYNSRGFHLKAAYGDHQNALLDFDKAIKINPNYAFAFNNRGFSRYKTGDLSKAFKDIKISLKKRSDNAWAYRNLAVIYIELGQKNEACRNAKQAVELKFTEQYGDAMKILIEEHCKKTKNRPRPRNAP